MTIYSNPAVARQTIDPQATDKLTAYREAFNNAPGKVQANRGRVAGEALYPYDITVLLKSQAQFIHDFQGTAPSALSNTQILDYQGRGGIIPTYTSYGQTTNNFNPTEVLKNHLDHSHYSLTNLATENNFNMLYDYTLLPLVLPLNANLPAGRRAEDIIGMAYEKAYDVLLNSIQTAPDMESINLLVPQMQDLIRVCNEDNIQLPAGKNQAALQIARTDRIAAIQAAANPHPQPQTYTAQAIFEEQEQEVQTASEPVSSAPSSNFSSPSTIPNPTTPQSNETPNNSPSSSSDSSSYSGSFGGFSSGGGGGGGSSSSSPSPSAPETTPPSTPPTPSPSPTPRPPVYPSADEAQEILKTAKKVQKETNASLEEIKKATDNLNNLLE
ncbi:10383_t:CDS:2, partial [Entrophospora sp. SA101]